ncbi:hypothetical protein [Alteromonas sp. ASW11-130]|uniref:hypothetical protein n=1 Tax=Alteromonas sp. ASW11-130 TaxID=3015775 RepID=UPI00224192A5|nr:hypothetical protein [Alteromonas sp. ASW11-130]MCW8092942.1 hypothetical protein [Alteromonas sp. ASW11-130]
MFKLKYPRLGLSHLFICLVAAIACTHSGIVFSAPGAHGPNGEHLDMENEELHTDNPKFESFTESFELLGEVWPGKVQLYLHEFATNRPVANASIELESGDISANAVYSNTLKHYQLNDKTFVSKLNQPGEHNIIVTILTEESGDLLATTLLTPAIPSSESNDDNHHHHVFSWTSAGIGGALLIAGIGIGYLTRGRRG